MRFALIDAPVVASKAVNVVPMSMPITKTAACSNPIKPEKSALRVAATPALEDWVMSVNIIPKHKTINFLGKVSTDNCSNSKYYKKTSDLSLRQYFASFIIESYFKFHLTLLSIYILG